MARRATAEADETRIEPVTASVVYKPGPMDPVQTKWGGLVFEANVPRELTGHPEGSDRERMNMHLIERARQNKLFEVDGERSEQALKQKLPTNSVEYKRYFAAWLAEAFDATNDNRIQHTDELIQRWVKDREVQKVCELGPDDYAYLGRLFLPRLHELQQGDALTSEQVANMWITHGVNQLPFDM